MTAVGVAAVLTAGLASVPALAAAPKKPAKAYDFNGDGKRDVVLSLLAERPVVVYGKSLRRQKLGIAAFSGVSADFDRDGYADLALDHEGGVTVVYGSKKGLGSRKAELTTAASTFGGPSGRLAVGDFDRDGKADLVATVDHDYRIFYGVGTGGVTASPVHVEVSLSYMPSQLIPVVADFTGDSRPDLVMQADSYDSAREEYDTRLLFAKGGEKGPGALKDLGYGAGQQAIRTGDFNGDGRADLASSMAAFDVGSLDTGVEIRYGTKNGLGGLHRITKADVKIPHNPQGEVGGFGNALAAADLNGDGRDELAVANAFNNTVWIFKGTKKGLAVRTVQRIAEPYKQAHWKKPARNFPTEVFLTDFTGDSRPDLVAATGNCSSAPRLYVVKNVKGSIIPKTARAKSVSMTC
ncbi:FG-GAP and VCBS repeat-containing protein [Actinocorallia sp. B10E7]|uniref:FG-GAP and VCBS repeat-containing protein n=1 Tax=Actinocorallia sp. B10E7 TaxID=3153558 RepID=UPI00325E4E4F